MTEAFYVWTEMNPMPSTLGRVCPHPCEDACNLPAGNGTEAVSVRAVERWLGDATAHTTVHFVEYHCRDRAAIAGNHLDG